MVAYTARAKHFVGLNKILRGKKVQFNRRERYLHLHEATLAEAQTWGLNPRGNRDELMVFTKLWRLLQNIEADCVIKAGRLVTLVRGVSLVLVDLGITPIPGIPQDPCTTCDVLNVMGVILAPVGRIRLQPQPLGLGTAHSSLSSPLSSQHQRFVLSLFYFLNVIYF
jgi:hypothetical protein